MNVTSLLFCNTQLNPVESSRRSPSLRDNPRIAARVTKLAPNGKPTTT